ncbi:MAG TPA: ABATE domain-containing protein [Stellaceae bacterium]|jgi:predicted RNA-binding Zn ribbon-like protein|nr:ABATE domain-containing protein [Stellaceae bacterium]
MTGTAAPASRAGTLPLVGGVLALDFCNTSSGRASEGHQEHLRRAADLLLWAGHAGILDADAAARLKKACADDVFAADLLRRALALREAIYRLNADLAAGGTPMQADIDIVAGTHAACLAKGRLTNREGGFGWSWDVDAAGAEATLGPIAASAMAVITAADKARLKQCHGHHCGWLFLDTTKSNNRRWCEMEVCGNRAKQQRRRGRLSA